MEDIVLIGGGGHCRSCIDVIETENKFRIAGIVDIKEKKGTRILGYEIFGCDEDLPDLTSKYKNFMITVGQVGLSNKRKELFESLRKYNISFPVIVSSHAYVSRHAHISEGTIIMYGVVINAGAKVGMNCIINTSSLIEHDAIIGDHCHISTGSIVNGECRIGEGSLIGSNSVINQCITIPENTIIGSGSVVIETISEKGTYAGNPARPIIRKIK
ncbi:MAG: acetyltransferase [Nitrospirae bacterium]|nr:acetyltransferase [Nitrospirota bacterium]MCL5978914.1 acetyltransferase [Nitrospirota bacterium]